LEHFTGGLSLAVLASDFIRRQQQANSETLQSELLIIHDNA